jgi:hypothetical protein
MILKPFLLLAGLTSFFTVNPLLAQPYGKTLEPQS